MAADGPVGPSESEEAAFLAEQSQADESAFSAPRPVARPDLAEPVKDDAPLPPLDDLVARIPVATRSLIDELFRAKFITVKRVPRSALKP